jgi:hypothetical protein
MFLSPSIEYPLAMVVNEYLMEDPKCESLVKANHINKEWDTPNVPMYKLPMSSWHEYAATEEADQEDFQSLFGILVILGIFLELQSIEKVLEARNYCLFPDEEKEDVNSDQSNFGPESQAIISVVINLFWNPCPHDG